MPSFLLVHSPLLGPSSLSRLAAEAERRGVKAASPDLRRAVIGAPPRVDRLVQAVVGSSGALEERVTVVGHSGAGAFLPEIGRVLGDRLNGLLFIDAVVPPRSGAHRTSSRVERLLDENTTAGLLAPWLDWWPRETVRALLPDVADEAALRHDSPQVPRALYDEVVPVPEDWSDWNCGYVRLGPVYDVEFVEAGERGWRRVSIAANHLAVFTTPDQVMDAIELVGFGGE